MYNIMNIYVMPSYYAHIINGLLLLVAVFIAAKNYPKIVVLEPYKLTLLTLCFSVAIGIHGLSHLGLEMGYGYNPMKMIL
jgi:hypothetical protein